MRITAQLVDTETGNHVWAEKYDREMADIFAVQDEVVRTIVSTLVGRVWEADTERAKRKPPTSLAAYEYVLRGNALPWDDAIGAAEATQLFMKAIETDPHYGFAHAMLANMLCRKWCDDLSSLDLLLDQACLSAKRAVELDPNEESTNVSTLGEVYLLQRSFDLAVNESGRPLKLTQIISGTLQRWALFWPTQVRLIATLVQTCEKNRSLFRPTLVLVQPWSGSNVFGSI